MSDSITLRVIFNIFKSILFLVALIAFLFAWSLNRDNLNRDNWPVTKGKIYHSNVVHMQTNLLGIKSSYYDLDVRYKYKVNNKVYAKQGLFVAMSDRSLKQDYFIEQAKKFKKDSIVNVYYNPKSPNQAYLVANIDKGIREFYSSTKRILYVSILLFLITPLISILKIKRFKRKNEIDYRLDTSKDNKDL